MKTAIVILNWNGVNYLKKFLPFLIQHTSIPDVAIYVADNGSTDDSIQLLKTEFNSVMILRFDQNYGFAGGYNRALAQITAD